jgi:hypothetical protein
VFTLAQLQIVLNRLKALQTPALAA